MASYMKCSGKRHRFMRPVRVVGGLNENPGVLAIDNGIRTKEVCSTCGCYKYETYSYANKRTKTEYREADEVSQAWIDLER